MSAELHTLVGPYALDALDQRERDAFESHLGACSTCPLELTEFQATVERLADAVAETPPTGLRTAVLERATRTPQLRPVVTHVPLSRWRRHASALLAAAAVLAAVVFGGLYLGEHQRTTELASEKAQIQAVMTAPDRVVSPRGDGDAPVQVVASQSEDAAVVMVDGLPAVDQDQAYEMWAIDDGGATSLGLLDGTSGSGTALVDGLGDATAVAVTVEEAGGSPTGQPTSDPVQAVELS